VNLIWRFVIAFIPGYQGIQFLISRTKLALVRLNLESFKAAIGGLKFKLWVLLDNCPPAYAELLKSIFPDTAMELIALGGEGNGPTYARQIDILSAQQAADLVYLAEDDYLYLPQSLEKAVAFLRRHPEADALTLADHEDRYVDRIRSRQHLEDGRRWRTVVATALTLYGSGARCCWRPLRCSRHLQRGIRIWVSGWH